MGSPDTLFKIGTIFVLGIKPKSSNLLLILLLQFISFIKPDVFKLSFVSGIVSINSPLHIYYSSIGNLTQFVESCFRLLDKN